MNEFHKPERPPLTGEEHPSALELLASQELSPLFWPPELLGKPSAWWAHVPFSFWAMSAFRPRLFVELGSHHGVSYAGFCESAMRSRTGSKCYAIDTWRGDRHADFYDDSVYWGL